MEGVDSDKFENFKSLFMNGLIEASNYLSDFESIITVMSKDSQMPCFKRPNSVMSELRERIKPPNVNLVGGIEVL